MSRRRLRTPAQGSPTFNERRGPHAGGRPGRADGRHGRADPRQRCARRISGIPVPEGHPVAGQPLLDPEQQSRTRTELLVLITPHVVHDQRDARALTEDLRSQLINAGLIPQQLQRKGHPGLAQSERPLGSPGRGHGGPDLPAARLRLIIVLWTLGADRFHRRPADGEREDGNPHRRESCLQFDRPGGSRRRDLRGHLQPLRSAAGDPLAARRKRPPARDRQNRGDFADRGRSFADQSELGFACPARGAAAGHRQRPETARRLAAAIGDWVGSAASPRPQDALAAEYRAAGLDYGPPGAALETLDELDRVLGMTPAVLAAIRPHLTLFGPPEPNQATTDPVVAAALALTAQAGPALAAGNQFAPDV